MKRAKSKSHINNEICSFKLRVPKLLPADVFKNVTYI